MYMFIQGLASGLVSGELNWGLVFRVELGRCTSYEVVIIHVVRDYRSTTVNAMPHRTPMKNTPAQPVLEI